MSKKLTSSPIATGGAGTFFEQHVGAYWLAQLLVGGIPPILIDCAVVEVHFQTEHLGWHTDDFLIDCELAGAGIRKLVGQVKRSFSVSAADDDCSKAVRDFWNDFKNDETFRPERDRLLLVTQRGTNVLLEHFVGLLDCARAAGDGAEFEARLATKGFISETAVRYCGELQKIVSELEARPITATDIWPFLRVLHLLSLDLDTSTRQAEAHIRSLLAYTVAEGDPLAAAGASWNALLALASDAMSGARSLRRDGMPEDLKHRHNSVGSNERRILRAVNEHSDLILRGIRADLGHGFHLARAALTQEVLSALKTSQVVLVSGPAGSGKSVVGKEAVRLLSSDHFTFGFRAEEFAQPHLDSTLQAAQIQTNGNTLAAILAAQDRKLIVVESIERLLEKPTRDAFADLMTLVSDDGGIGVILTCRDYSVDQVRASFLQPARIKHAVVTLPPLSDSELAEVQAALPALAFPLKSPALRGILGNPYFLDKALEISWSADRPLPESEREFRVLFWRQIVRADHRVSAGTARRREQIFQEIAVRRARALSSHVVCNDLDPEVVAHLKNDGLINSPDEKASSAATAHDVLEDWAILHWIEEQNLVTEGSFKSLAVAIGGHPAIRRSYRKWLSELVDHDPAAADRLFVAAISDTEIGAQFRDDTLVSLLKAPSAPEFLMRHEARLLANDRVLLKRVIHLLRVACMTSPTWIAGDAALEVSLSVPDGPAWAAVLRIVHHNVASFAPGEHLLLLGLAEDAVRSVSWWAPDVPGAEQVAGIAHALLLALGDYPSEKLLNRALKVIAKIPKADPPRFEALLRGTINEGERRDRVGDEFRKIVFSGLDGYPAARDLPDVVLSVAPDYLLAAEESQQRNRYLGASTGVERYFGVKEKRSHDSFPASAIRGPWGNLLRYSPDQALDFFVRVFNHSANCYAHPRFERSLEPAWEIEIAFADGTARKQWGNPRLWSLYRGLSVGPCVLQSILMALESWLLGYAKQYPQQLDAILVGILRRSESASLAAVVASIATAHPQTSGEALLVLLSAPDYIRFDLGRRAAESQTAVMSGMFQGINAENRIYKTERKTSDGLPHRGESLEDAITKVQFGPFAQRVHAALDRHGAALPPLEQQDDRDRMWRLAMYRMDLRQYTASEVEVSETPTAGDCDAPQSQQRSIRFAPMDPEPDVKEMMDKSAVRLGALNTRLRLLNWAWARFKRDTSADPTMWHDLLSEVMPLKPDDDQTEGFELARDGPGILAAVCIREHWEDMTALQRDWCIVRVCAEVMASGDEWDRMHRLQRYGGAADRACAWVISLLSGKPLTETQRSLFQPAFVAALTHPITEVRWNAVSGVANNLSRADRAFAARCINALAMEVTIFEADWRAQSPDKQDRDAGGTATAAANAVRDAFWEPHGIPLDAYERLNVEEWSGADANAQILTILSADPDNADAVPAFVRASQTLVKWWDLSDDQQQGHAPRNQDAETGISDRIQDFVARTCYESAASILEPILGAIDRHPREIHWIVQGLTAIEDGAPNTAHYWRLWNLFAKGVRSAKWTPRLTDQYSDGGEMLSAIFLTAYWKDDVRHWRSLEGHAHHVHALFESLPPSWIVLDSYVRFLYHIGERSLPEAFGRIANSLRTGDAQTMLADTNTVFLLEVLLQRHVYGKPLELKRQAILRDAVLCLLDTLVENGSPSAFRMRDDFVTPASA